MRIHIFILILFSLSITSCMTVSRIKRNCDKFAEVCYIPSSTVIRDTIAYINPINVLLPVSDINITLELKVINNIVNLEKQVFKSGLIITEVSIVNNKLNVKSFLGDSTILVKPDPIIIPGAIKEVEKILKVKYIPKVYKWALNILILAIIYIVIFTYLNIKGKTLAGIFGGIKNLIFKPKT